MPRTVSQTRARRVAAAVRIQARFRGAWCRERTWPALQSHARQQKRAEILQRAKAVANTVATFKTRPCGRRHATAEEAKCCPFYHGNGDRRHERLVFGGGAHFYSKFEWLTSAPVYKTSLCHGKCGNRQAVGGVCPFAHGEGELLPKIPRGESFAGRDDYEMHVAQHLLLKAGLPLVCETPLPPKPAPAPLPPEPCEQEKHACIVCFNAPIQVALTDCGHAQLCRSCTKLLTDCPTCRTPIAKAPLQIFF